MSPPRQTHTLESLLLDSAWMRQLALGLVHDESQADDLVQEARLVALERPPPRATAPRGWIRSVLRTHAYRAYRDEQRRKTRERAASRAEATRGSAEDLLARLELQRRTAELVLGLPEPLRSTVILRYYEGLNSGEIAGREGVPASTVRTRLSRALGRLREQLDRLHGGRRVWCLVLAPLALEREAAGAVVLGPGVAGAGSGTGTATKLGVSWGLTLMTKKVALAAAALAACGWVLFTAIQAWGPAAAPGQPAISSDRLAGQLEQLRSELNDAHAQRDRALAENQGLRDQLAALASRVRPAGDPDSPADAAEAPASGGEASGINWGEFAGLVSGNLDVLTKAQKEESLTEEEKARLDLLRGELIKVSARAKSMRRDPLFDQEILSELVHALFERSLALTDDQASKLTEIAGSLIQALPPNVAELSAFEKYKVRQDMIAQLWTEVESILHEDQRARWDVVSRYSEQILHYGRKLTAGIASSPPSFLGNYLANTVPGPVDPLKGQLQPLAEAYLEDAKSALQRYGTTGEEIQGLAPEKRARLEAELLELQERFQRQILPQLTEEQRAHLLTREPLIVRFTFDAGISIYGLNSYF